MQHHVGRTQWSGGTEAYAPLLFHRTDSFRFLERGGRIGITRIEGGPMVLARVRSTGHDITLEEPDRLTLLFPWAGRITCAVAEDMTSSDAGGVLAFGPNQRRTVVERPGPLSPYQADVLTLPISALHEVMQAEDLAPREIAPRHDPAAGAMARIRGLAGRLLTSAETGAPLDERTLEAALADLSSDLVLALADPDHPAPSAGARRVAQAIALMQALHAEPISIAVLARGLGCSTRSLQVAFRECGHDTPQEVLARIRLDAARIRLLSGGRSVTDSALESGISHLSRFAQAYRHRFGEKPSETLAARR